MKFKKSTFADFINSKELRQFTQYTLAFWIVWAATLFLQKNQNLTPVISTENGLVQGSIASARNGQEFWQFLGIPYSRPPVGDLRFAPPQPAKNWDGVKRTTSYPPSCARFDLFFTLRPQGSLDCLYLNVFVNVASGFNGTTGRPVLVALVGGAYITGFSELYQPDLFMDQNIVLVVFNYRLGPFGFLNLQDVPEAPKGNMGLLDQLMVLKWVQNNIANFGGDPNKVTLFGESAGAMAAELHMLSPLSQGLFQKVILHSGSILAPFAINRDQYQISKRYSESMGCSAENSSAVWKCFQNADWKTVVNYQHCLVNPLLPKDWFQPRVDGYFLPDVPENILKSGNYSKVPVLTGATGDEGAIRVARLDAMPELIKELDENWVGILSTITALENELPTSIALKTRQKYLRMEPFWDDPVEFKRNFSKMVSDLGFLYPIHKSATYHARNGAPVRMFYFNYTSKIYPGTYCAMQAGRLDDWVPSELKLFWRCLMGILHDFILGGSRMRPHGVAHAEELYQLWNMYGVSKYFASWDADFSQSYIKALVDFANGTENSLLKFRGTPWPTINQHLNQEKSKYSVPYMLMDNQNIPKVIPEPHPERMQFWENLEGWEY